MLNQFVRIYSTVGEFLTFKYPKIRIYLKTGLTQRIYEENIQYNSKIPARNRIKFQFVDEGSTLIIITGMRTLTALLFLCVSLMSIAQNRTCREIKITHTYEELYFLYIAPKGCDENQKHGPIIVTDSLVISKICTLLLKIRECQECLYEPDVRFKAEFVFDNESYFLCFGESGESNLYAGMSYAGKLYNYYSPLCSMIIDIIKKSGAKTPERVKPPKLNKPNIM